MTLGPVRVMGAGVIVMRCAEEVNLCCTSGFMKTDLNCSPLMLDGIHVSRPVL